MNLRQALPVALAAALLLAGASPSVLTAQSSDLAARMLENARTHLREKRFSDGVKALQEVIAQNPNTAVAADALLDQDIFAGVGNIIKNEVLFRIRVHPESRIGALPPRKLSELIREARNYSFDFLEWKKAFKLRAHWLAHAKNICPRDNIPFVKIRHLGKRKRRVFFCPKCQKLYILKAPK